MNKHIYMVLWLIRRPYVKFLQWLSAAENLDKPAILLKTFLFITMLVAFPNTFSLFHIKLIGNYLLYLVLFFVVIIYIWKHTDPEYGQLWKRDYNIYLERKVQK